MLIKNAANEDIHAITQVIRASIRAAVLDHHNDEALITQWLANKTPENIAIWLRQNLAFCAWVGDDINTDVASQKMVGIIMLGLASNEAGRILLNYVHPDYQNQGIGRALMNHVKAYLCQTANGCRLSQLSVESTHTAKKFYASQGFECQYDVIEGGEIVGFEMVCDRINA